MNYECIIRDSELSNLPIRQPNRPMEQVVLRLLKDKGVPIVGTTWLSLDPAYNLKWSYDAEYSWTRFQWESKDETKQDKQVRENGD